MIAEEKLPRLRVGGDKETLGNPPKKSPQEGLKALIRAAESGVFTIENNDRNNRYRPRK